MNRTIKRTLKYCWIIITIFIPACSTIPLNKTDDPSPDTVAVSKPSPVSISDSSSADRQKGLYTLSLPDNIFNDTISIAAVGDIMMGSCFPVPLLPPDSGKGLFQDCQKLLGSADLAFGNLEGPLCDNGKPAKTVSKGRSYAFRSPTSFAGNLYNAGFDVMSLANNHANDFGATGSLSTKRALDSMGIQYSGKDTTVAEFIVNGRYVALIALAAGAPPRSVAYPLDALREIDSLAKIYDILIVSIHGGPEGRSALHITDAPEKYLKEPRGHLIKLAHDAIDRGADLIIGHGPHVPRGLEVYKERLIAYSLGNFCTYGGINVSRESGYAPLLRVSLDTTGRCLDFNIRSFIQNWPGGPQLDSLERAAALMKQLSIADFPNTHPYQQASPLPFKPTMIKEEK